MNYTLLKRLITEAFRTGECNLSSGGRMLITLKKFIIMFDVSDVAVYMTLKNDTSVKEIVSTEDVGVIDIYNFTKDLFQNYLKKDNTILG